MTSQPKNKSGLQKYRNQIIIGLMLALGIYIILLLFLDNQGQFSQTDGVLEQLTSFPIWIIPLVISCQILVIIFRFIEWQYYLGVVGAREKLPWFDSLIIFMFGFTMVVSPGKAAEVLKAVFVRAKTNIPIARTVPVVLAERIVDGIAVIAILMISLLLAGDRLELGEYSTASQAIIFFSAIALIAGLIVVQIQSLADFFLNLIAKLPLIKRFHRFFRDFYQSSREVFHLKHVIPMSFVGTGVYASSAVGFFLILIGLGLPPSWQLFLEVTFILGVSSAIGALSFVPNGAGVTEISNTAMLTVIVAPQYPEMTIAVATAAAILQGFFHKWFRVLAGLLFTVIFRKRLFSGDVETALVELEAMEMAKAT